MTDRAEKKSSAGLKVGRALQFVGAGLLVLSFVLLAAWAVRLFGSTKASRDNATLGVVTFGVWALVGAVFLAVGTVIRRPKAEQ
jgi:flagellar biogenesis protein FliO